MKEIKLFPVVTICGSMRYYDEMLRLAELLTYKQYIVLMPFAMKDKILTRDTESQQEVEAMLDRMHKVKIDMCDIVLIVNTKEIDNVLDYPAYVGNSTRSEIAYADEKGKKVLFYTALLLTERLHLTPSILDAL